MRRIAIRQLKSTTKAIFHSSHSMCKPMSKLQIYHRRDAASTFSHSTSNILSNLLPITPHLPLLPLCLLLRHSKHLPQRFKTHVPSTKHDAQIPSLLPPFTFHNSSKILVKQRSRKSHHRTRLNHHLHPLQH